jgi:hypothetical protein
MAKAKFCLKELDDDAVAKDFLTNLVTAVKPVK